MLSRWPPTSDRYGTDDDDALKYQRKKHNLLLYALTFKRLDEGEGRGMRLQWMERTFVGKGRG